MTNLTFEEFQRRLTEYLSAMSGQPVAVENLQPLAGGASRDTWLIDAQFGDEVQRLVLRRDRPTSMHENALERAEEFRLLRIAHEYGVSVPLPRWFCNEPQILGERFLIMDHVEGESIGSKVVKSPQLERARRSLPEQMAGQLARIHAIDTDQQALAFLPTPSLSYSPARSAIKDARQKLARMEIESPVFAFALRWTEAHAPSAEELTLVHGDFRIGNFLVGEDGLNAIIDWEFSHIGDLSEDLAWPCVRDWRFGNGHLRLGGIADREPFLQAYERHSGRSVDREAVDFWEIMGNLRWAISALAQAHRHLSGRDPSVEFASLGRRSAEMQLELLHLIKERGT